MYPAHCERETLGNEERLEETGQMEAGVSEFWEKVTGTGVSDLETG